MNCTACKGTGIYKPPYGHLPSKECRKCKGTKPKCEDSELKPCPFCGGEAFASYYGEYRFIACTECFCRGQRFDVTTTHNARQLAKDAWNKRA